MGFTFRQGNAADLERMLRVLISEPEIRNAAARKARAKVRDGYLWDRIARQIESQYLALANGNSVKTPVASVQPASYRKPRAA